MMQTPVSIHEEIGFHPLEGPLLKVGRAREHFDVLRRECESFMEDEPYDWRIEYEDLPDGRREYTVFAEVTDEPAVELGLVAGDVIQNLRAALDQLIWGISDPNKRGVRTAFPIYLTEEDYLARAFPKIEGVIDAGRARIEQWQPYHWKRRAGEHPLATLQRLSNLDKHRTLLPVTVARRNEFVAGYGSWKIDQYTTHRKDVPAGDEARVITFITSGEPPDRANVNAYLTFEVAVEGHTLADLESIFVHIGTQILGWFDRD